MKTYDIYRRPTEGFLAVREGWSWLWTLRAGAATIAGILLTGLLIKYLKIDQGFIAVGIFLPHMLVNSFRLSTKERLVKQGFGWKASVDAENAKDAITKYLYELEHPKPAPESQTYNTRPVNVSLVAGLTIQQIVKNLFRF